MRIPNQEVFAIVNLDSNEIMEDMNTGELAIFPTEGLAKITFDEAECEKSSYNPNQNFKIAKYKLSFVRYL